MPGKSSKTFFTLLAFCIITFAAEQSGRNHYALKLTVTDGLTVSNIPMDPEIDFSDIIEKNKIVGVLDHNSIVLTDLTSGEPIPFSLSAGLTFGYKGRLQWVIKNPDHRKYEISFNTSAQRNLLQPQRYTPMVGVGDVYRYNAGIPRPVALVFPSAFTDITGDGKRDLVGFWMYPRYPRGLVDTLPGTGPVIYPRVGNPTDFEFGEPLAWQDALPIDPEPKSFSEAQFDVDSDGLSDKIELTPRGNGQHIFGKYLTWQKRLSESSPAYASPQPLKAFQDLWAISLLAVNNGPLRGLIVQLGAWQDTAFFFHTPHRDGRYFTFHAKAASISAVMGLGDQAWPYICDWDDDGDWDMLIGGGIGWPRILVNHGTHSRPAFAEAQNILSQGRPIRIWMSQVFPGCEDYKHDMGYTYPKFIDWDGDGRKDLMLPNITNRIFWYKNIGTKKRPEFGPRRQILPDGCTETDETLAATGQYLMANWESEPQAGQPFWWRTGAGFADFNNDGLMDMITLDGFTRELQLFRQYQDDTGRLRLKEGRELKLTDGRVICEDIVGRTKHWTESFQCCDWDNDGLIDIMYSLAGGHGMMQDGGSIYLLRNKGTKKEPVFDKPRTMSCFGSPIMITSHGPHPGVGDINGDGKPDILTCHEDSIYAFFSHIALEMSNRPHYRLSQLMNK